MPAGGENVLQTIRGKRGAAEAAGVKLLDLSIGEPKGAAFLSAREAAAVESAEHFNFMMIDETGLVGVHFPGYIRYAVCADVAAMSGEIGAAFDKAQVSYD